MVRINPIISKGLNLADDIGGQSVRNWKKTKTFKGLRFAPHATADVFKASSNIDYLSADFIKSLLKIEGNTKIETATMIKDEILKAMKYKKPSTLILTESPKLEAPASFILAEGKIGFRQKLDPDTKEMLIAVLYHELDHMDKFVKLYKALGEEAFETLIKKDIPTSQQHKYQWNKEFYKIIPLCYN